MDTPICQASACTSPSLNAFCFSDLIITEEFQGRCYSSTVSRYLTFLSLTLCLSRIPTCVCWIQSSHSFPSTGLTPQGQISSPHSEGSEVGPVGGDSWGRPGADRPLPQRQEHCQDGGSFTSSCPLSPAGDVRP